jgi:hypothetical protein
VRCVRSHPGGIEFPANSPHASTSHLLQKLVLSLAQRALHQVGQLFRVVAVHVVNDGVEHVVERHQLAVLAAQGNLYIQYGRLRAAARAHGRPQLFSISPYH